MALRGTQTITVKNTISNTSVNLIQITEDKLENILIKHVDKMKRVKDLRGAAGLALASAGLLFATEPKDCLGLPQDTWKALFVIAFFGSVFYLARVCWNCFRCRDSIENIIKDIKNEKCDSEK